MSATTNTDFDPAAVEAFAGRMVGVINDSMLALSISIGHQTGLFDTMAGLAPSTSEQIAGAGGLQERYVREILGALVTGGIVTYDAAASTYALPPEHAAVLAHAAGVDNLAAVAQFAGILGAVEQDIVRCFREGGGVPYSSFPTFQRQLSELTKATIDATLLDVTLPLVPGLRERLETGIDVVDIGCGSGYLSNVLAREFPNSRFSGYDFSEEAVAAATAQAKEWGLSNVTFDVRDVTDLGLVDAFDFITTFDAIHDQVAPDRVLKGIADALRPGGVYLCVDIAASSHLEENLEHPLAPFIYTISTMHCMAVSLANGGAGLGTAWGRQLAMSMLADAGFTATTAKYVEGDPLNVYYIATKA